MKRIFSVLLITMCLGGKTTAAENLYDTYFGRPTYFKDFVQPTVYANNMNYTVKAYDSKGEPLVNYEVEVYDQNNELRSTARSIVENDNECMLTICGEEGDTFHFEVLYGDLSQPTVKKILQTCEFHTNDLVGTDTPFRLTVDEKGKPAHVCFRFANVSAGAYRAVCLPYEVDCVNGTAYEIVGIEDGRGIYLKTVKEMKPGKPYVLKCTEDGNLDLVYRNISCGATAKVQDPETENNGLMGTFVDNGNVPLDMYVFDTDQLCIMDCEYPFLAYRVYVDPTKVTTTSTESDEFVEFSGSFAVGINGVTGQRIVKTYDFSGKRVSGTHPGAFILEYSNGLRRKVIRK